MHCDKRRWTAHGAHRAALALALALTGQAQAEECLTYRTEKCPDKPNIPVWNGKGPDPLLAPPVTPVQRTTGKGRSRSGTRAGAGEPGGGAAQRDDAAVQKDSAVQQITQPGLSVTPPPDPAP